MSLEDMYHYADGTAAELEQVTGKKIRTNQEGRDAALLAWTHADLPVSLDFKTLKALFS